MTVRRAAFLAGIVSLVLVFAFCLRRPGVAPPGQPLLIQLNGTNFSEFEKAFDQSADVPRMVLLLSPT